MAQARNPDRFAEMAAIGKRVEPARREVAAALFADHLDLAAIRLALGHKETTQLPVAVVEPPRPLVAPEPDPCPMPNPTAVAPARTLPPRRSTQGLHLIGAAGLGIAGGVFLGLLWFTFFPMGAQTPERLGARAEPASTASRLAERSKSTLQSRPAEFPAPSPRFDVTLPIVMATAPMSPAAPTALNELNPLPRLVATPARIAPSRPAPPRNAPTVLSAPTVTAVAPILTAVPVPAIAPALSLSRPHIFQVRLPDRPTLTRSEVPPAPPPLIALSILTPEAITNAPHPRPAAAFAAHAMVPTAHTRRLVVHYSAARAAPARPPIETRLRAAGFSRVEWRAVPFAISRTNARFFHATDRLVTDKVIAALEGSGYTIDARDFTHFVPLPAPGTIELWLAR